MKNLEIILTTVDAFIVIMPQFGPRIQRVRPVYTIKRWTVLKNIYAYHNS